MEKWVALNIRIINLTFWRNMMMFFTEPKFSFSEKNIRRILAMIRGLGLPVNPSPTGEVLVDMDDLVFFEVVMEKRDDDAYLITGNTKHFPKRDYIVTPAEMMEIVDVERKKPRLN